LPEAEETISGVTIPKGLSLLDVFPDGLCALGINGMKTILAIWPENHKDHIVSGLYHVQSFSGVGKGISDAVDVKKEMDSLHSQKSAFIKGHSMPCWGFNANVVTEEQVRQIGDGRRALPFDFSQAPEGARSINDLIQALVPGNPGTAVFQLEEKLNQYLQMSMQVTDFSNGLPGVDNKTATGAQIGDANAEMVLVPQHRNKADHRKRADKVIYNLFRRFVNKPKFFASRDKNGISAGQFFSGNQFGDVDINFEIVANSEVSVTPFQQRDALAMLFQYTGGAMGLIQMSQMNPEITGQIVRAFGVKGLSIPTQNDIAKVCRQRIEDGKKILGAEMQRQQAMMGALEENGIPAPPMDNSMLAQSVVAQIRPAIDPKEDFAALKVQWLRRLLDTDELTFAPPEIRAMIGAMIDAHISLDSWGKAQMQFDQEMPQIAAQLPMLLGEQAFTAQNEQMTAQIQAAQMQQQAQIQEQQAVGQAQQTLQLEGMKADVSEKQAEAAHERQLAMSDKGHRQNLELEKVRARNKPKGK
jgi:hypothetical protein